MNLISWNQIIIVALPTIIIPAGLFFLRHWIKAWIESSIKHDFSKELENIRSEHRKSEADLSSQLRNKETEISALREVVLSGRTNRQALLDKRRIEAVERIWAGVGNLLVLKNLSHSLSYYNLEEVVKRAPHEENLRKVFEIMTKGVPEHPFDNNIMNERPFLSPLAWAYFSAYQSIVGASFGLAKALELGVSEADKMIDQKRIKELVKVAMPELRDHLDKYESMQFAFLLDILEEKLLNELKRTLDGEEADRASIEKAATIIREAGQLSKEISEKANSPV